MGVFYDSCLTVLIGGILGTLYGFSRDTWGTLGTLRGYSWDTLGLLLDLFGGTLVLLRAFMKA